MSKKLLKNLTHKKYIEACFADKKKEEKFFYRGQFFSTQEKFFEEVKEWPKRKATQDSIKLIFSMFKEDVFLNIDMYNLPLTNAQVERVFENMFNVFIEKYLNMIDYDDDQIKIKKHHEYPLVPWIAVSDQKPPERDILVWGKCDKPHIAFWDYNVHLHAESCNEKGHHFPGGDIEFTHWTELPIGPATWYGCCVATPTMKVENL